MHEIEMPNVRDRPASWKESRYHSARRDGIVCQVCPKECTLAVGQWGYCGTRVHAGGTLWTTTYGLVSHALVEPIEKKPIYHYRPGARVYALGGYGCTWRCRHCRNEEFACLERVAGGDSVVSPEAVVARAREAACDGIAWSYNEPALWTEFIADTMSIAAEAGLFGLVASNGGLTDRTRDILLESCALWRIDIKGFSDAFHARLGVGREWRAVLDTAIEAHRRGRHVEIVSCVISGHNEQEVPQVAAWLVDNLGPEVPLHLLRFFPNREWTSIELTPLPVMHEVATKCQGAGLQYVYVCAGAMATRDTRCGGCGAIAVHRSHGGTSEDRTQAGHCRGCGLRVLSHG